MKLTRSAWMRIWLSLVICITAYAQTPGPEEQQYLFSVLPLIEKGQLKQAEEKLRTGLEVYPRSAILENALGIVYQRQNKAEKAEAAFQRALDLLPSFTAAQLHLALIFQQQDRKKEAVELFTAVGGGTYDFEALSAAGLGLAQCKEYRHAIRVLDKARSLQPDSRSIVYNLALARYKVGEFRPALDTLKSIRTREGEDADLVFLLGQIKQALNERGCSDDMARACRQEPSVENYCLEASLALIKEERFGEALTILQRALKKSSSSASLLSTLGLVQFRVGKYPEAIQSYKQDLEQNPSSDAPREGLAFLLYMTGDLETARTVTEAGLRNPQADFYLDQLHAMILYRLSPEHWKEALRSTERALQKNLRFAPSYFLRGKIEMEINQLDAALRDFREAAELDAKYPLPHYRMAQIYLKQGRLEEAETARKKFFELGYLREEELLIKQTQEVLIRRAGE